MSQQDRAGGARGQLILSMFIFGTIGLFRRWIDLPSGVLALSRSVIAAVFLLALGLMQHREPDLRAMRRDLPLLCLSGAALGFNWILLFESYTYTSVATATLCYYMAPIFVMLASPLLGERLGLRRGVGVLAALGGMVLVSGVADSGLPEAGEARGILLGLGAAVLDASVILLNKRTTNVAGRDRAVIQLCAAAVVLFVYTLVSGELAAAQLTPRGAALAAVVGIVHTGLAYVLYFGSMNRLSAQTVALLSYIDPVVAVLLSALVLHETLTPAGGIGAVLILGAAAVSELAPEKKETVK